MGAAESTCRICSDPRYEELRSKRSMAMQLHLAAETSNLPMLVDLIEKCGPDVPDRLGKSTVLKPHSRFLGIFILTLLLLQR
jgi:hypothetical protein